MTTPEPERAFLVGVRGPSHNPRETENHLAELAELAANIGLATAEKTVVNLKTPFPRYLVGSGKAEEIREAAAAAGAEFIVFDDEISPSQQRNWEELTGLCVIDRQEVILEIFARRALTREARLQVDLARMEYSLPRLTRAWTHLSRQRGGRQGTRDAGETQLEIDRRRVLARIDRAKRELENVRKNRRTRRSLRERTGIRVVSLVGYTNAGKSSLLNALTGSGVLVEDKLFATLDPTTRKLWLPSGETVLVTDTVGFIRKLPHRLVEAFKATLEETAGADLLIHVLDASDPEMRSHASATREVLREIGAEDKPVVTAFNKIDLCRDLDLIRQTMEDYPNPALLSAATGEGLPGLLAEIDSVLSSEYVSLCWELPRDRQDLVSLLRKNGRIISQDYTERGVEICALVSRPLRELLAPYLLPPSPVP